jgi:hypothetical protein
MGKWVTGAVLVLALAGLQTEGGDKKLPPKQDPNVAFTDAVKAGPDYAIQGEYAGKLKIKDTEEKVGAQLVARGDGKFVVQIYPGGLPGAGWDGVHKHSGTAETSGGVVTVKGKDFTAKIVDGKLIGGGGTSAFAMERIERRSPTLGKNAPADAVVLFDGKSADEWQRGKVVEGNLLSPLAPGNIVSKKKFKDFHLHLEFRTPFMPYAGGQARGNSGVYLQDRYELQVLDSFGLKGENNEAGGFYQQAAPKVNMCLPPLQWQTYDIDFTAARFDGDGKKVKNAVVTVHHNGVLIHDKLELQKETPGGQKETDTAGPIQLQNHGNPVYYRNIWVVEKK